MYELKKSPRPGNIHYTFIKNVLTVFINGHKTGSWPVLEWYRPYESPTRAHLSSEQTYWIAWIMARYITPPKWCYNPSYSYQLARVSIFHMFSVDSLMTTLMGRYNLTDWQEVMFATGGGLGAKGVFMGVPFDLFFLSIPNVTDINMFIRMKGVIHTVRRGSSESLHFGESKMFLRLVELHNALNSLRGYVLNNRESKCTGILGLIRNMTRSACIILNNALPDSHEELKKFMFRENKTRRKDVDTYLANRINDSDCLCVPISDTEGTRAYREFTFSLFFHYLGRDTYMYSKAKGKYVRGRFSDIIFIPVEKTRPAMASLNVLLAFTEYGNRKVSAGFPEGVRWPSTLYNYAIVSREDGTSREIKQRFVKAMYTSVSKYKTELIPLFEANRELVIRFAKNDVLNGKFTMLKELINTRYKVND